MKKNVSDWWLWKMQLGAGVKTNGYIEAGQRWRLIWDDENQDQGEDDVGEYDNDDDDEDGDDICIMMKCLAPCVSRKIITSSLESSVTTVTTLNHPVHGLCGFLL